MGKKNKKLSPAELAAQQEAMEAAQIQQAFEQGTNTLRDLIKNALEKYNEKTEAK